MGAEEDDYVDHDLPPHAMGSPPELVEIVVCAALGVLVVALLIATCAVVDRYL
jgi:hypothetical protein